MKLKITDQIPALEGEYELVFSFTNGEWHQIKKATGLRPREFDEAWSKRDPDVFIALAIVALGRAGKDVEEAIPLLWNAPPRALTFAAGDDDEEEVEEQRPPASPTASGNEKELVVEETQTENVGSSGLSSKKTSDSQESDQSLTGDQTSVIGSPV